MTIKQFAKLCGCNPQTLRYYDGIDLLKPVKVDLYSNYRYYDENQVITYFKIKNLQKAGFSIEEIKSLLTKDDKFIIEAFTEKITQLEKRLNTIKNIKESYQANMVTIRENLVRMKTKILESIEDYNPKEEFNINDEQFERIKENIRHSLECVMESSNADLDMSLDDYDDVKEDIIEEKYTNILDNKDYEIIFEKHGFNHLKEFFNEISDLEDKREHVFHFELNEDSLKNPIAFQNTLLGILLDKNKGKQINISTNISDSKDLDNHFYLLRSLN